MAIKESFNVFDNVMGAAFGRSDNNAAEQESSRSQTAPEPENAIIKDKSAPIETNNEVIAVNSEPPKEEVLKAENKPAVLNPFYEKKENKSIKKTYLLLPSVYNKLEAAANAYGMTQNELVNQILKRALSEE